MVKSFKDIPEPLREKFDKLMTNVETVIKRAEVVQKTEIPGGISFDCKTTTRHLLTEHERAQSVCFVTRYEHLPIMEDVSDVSIVEENGKYYLNNIAFIRHVLNEYRSIIQNQNDSVYYRKIHKLCRGKLVNRDASEGLVISVLDEKDVDISSAFIAFLDEQVKAIKVIMDNCDFGYIYNGILQHSDHNFTERFLREYNSGVINYIFIKNASLLGYIKGYLYRHYRLLKALTFPKLGPL